MWRSSKILSELLVNAPAAVSVSVSVRSRSRRRPTLQATLASQVRARLNGVERAGVDLEIVLGVKALTGSNPVSSASYQGERRGTRMWAPRRSAVPSQFPSQLTLLGRYWDGPQAAVILLVVVRLVCPDVAANLGRDGCYEFLVGVHVALGDRRVRPPHQLHDRRQRHP